MVFTLERRQAQGKEFGFFFPLLFLEVATSGGLLNEPISGLFSLLKVFSSR